MRFFNLGGGDSDTVAINIPENISVKSISENAKEISGKEYLDSKDKGDGDKPKS